MTSRTPAVMTRSLVYCLRQTGSLIFRESDSGAFETCNGFRTPYGITLQHAQSRLLISDKETHQIFAVPINGPASFGVPIEFASLPDECRSPCSIDWHPSRGLLVACYGDPSTPGCVAVWNGHWQNLTAVHCQNRVTHCCWLDEGYCFVSRYDSVLWHAESVSSTPWPLTAPGQKRRLCLPEGPLSQLRLRYVQGILYDRANDRLLIADASLGAIFGLQISSKTYHAVAGRPTLSDSNFRTDLGSSGDANVWLGPVRGIALDQDGTLLWLDGERGRIFRASNSDYELVGSALPLDCNSSISGTGMITL